ncbi:unnamed protein product, partial [Ectocarpus sp. 13 AM-2016]
NQAIGRVIRHRLDYGCVVLCDSRFAEDRNRKSLSLWARPFVRECSGFGKVAADLTKFFKACAANPSLKHVDTRRASKPTPAAPSHGRPQPPSSSSSSSSYARARPAAALGPGGLPRSSSLQDVGDIVESVVGDPGGGTRKRVVGDGSGAGGGGGGGGTPAAPLGLLDALKASVRATDGGAVVSDQSSTRGGSSSTAMAAFSSSERSAGGSGSAATNGGGGIGRADEPRGGGGGWDSVPLSQRLATASVGGKASGGAAGAATPGTTGVKPTKQQQQQQNKQGGRLCGLSGQRTVGGEGSGGGAAADNGAARAGGSSSASSKPRPRPGVGVEDRRPIPRSAGSGGTDNSGGGGGRAGVGSSRRRELAAVLVELKRNVAPGAFELFRSRARALK